MMNTITVFLSDGARAELPARYISCAYCYGEGKSSAYLGAYSATEFNKVIATPEDQENYFNGAYDRPCPDCGGTGKLLVIDRDACTTDLYREGLAQYDEDKRDAEYHTAECAAESRMLGDY